MGAKVLAARAAEAESRRGVASQWATGYAKSFRKAACVHAHPEMFERTHLTPRHVCVGHSGSTVVETSVRKPRGGPPLPHWLAAERGDASVAEESTGTLDQRSTRNASLEGAQNTTLRQGDGGKGRGVAQLSAS